MDLASNGRRIALGGLLLFLSAACLARTVEEVAEVTVTVTNLYGREFTQPIKITVFRDDERKRSPFLILNHGRPASSADFIKMGRVRYSDNARYFVAKGFAVFVPTRVGYGVSGGEDMEYSGTCSSRNYPPAYEAAAVRAQAHVTHNNPVSDAACETLALMVQDFIRGRSPVEVLHLRAHGLTARIPAFAFRGRRRENPSGYIVDTVQAVFQALFDTDGFEDCLVDVVNRGGDADTTGAIAGMLAGHRYGLAAIPGRWLKALEPAVREACERQAKELLGCRS